MKEFVQFLLLCARPGEARRTLWVKMQTVELYSELVVSKLTSEKIVDPCVCGLYACCMRHEEENE